MRCFGLLTFAVLVVGVAVPTMARVGELYTDSDADDALFLSATKKCKQAWERMAEDDRADPPTLGTCGGRVNWLIQNHRRR